MQQKYKNKQVNNQYQFHNRLGHSTQEGSTTCPGLMKTLQNLKEI